MRIGPDGIPFGRETIYAESNRRLKKRFLYGMLALVLLTFLYLCVRTTKIGLLNPLDTVLNLYTLAKLKAAQILHLSVYQHRMEIIDARNGYLETLSRLETAVIAVVLGAVMSVAGAVFQCVFRNPIAVPTMLGVSSGISIGNLILVLQYSVMATSMLYLRFAYGYAFSIALLGFILLVGKLTSRGKGFAVADVLLIGTALSRVITQILNTVARTVLEDTSLLIYQQMNQYGTGIGNVRGWFFLVIALVVGFVPILLMRNSLNIVTFSDEEARVMGLNATLLRIVALVFSTVLIITAQIYCGEIGMLALLVPHVCRYLFGSNTKDLIAGSVLMGGIIMILCRFVVALTYFSDYLAFVSVSMIVNLVCFPLTMFIMITDRKGWE